MELKENWFATIIEWIQKIELRLDNEIPTEEERSDEDEYVAEHIQVRLGQRVVQMDEHKRRFPNEEDGFISQNAVAASLLWAAPPHEKRTIHDSKLVDKLEVYARDAKGAQWQKIKTYIDKVCCANVPGENKTKLKDL